MLSYLNDTSHLKSHFSSTFLTPPAQSHAVSRGEQVLLAPCPPSHAKSPPAVPQPPSPFPPSFTRLRPLTSPQTHRHYPEEQKPFPAPKSDLPQR